MTDKKTIREGAAVTENEAVERLAKLLWSTPDKSRGDGWTMHSSDLTEDDWREVARTALTSHPAVYALRKLLDAQCHADGPEVLGHVMQEARNVLASLPKDE